MTDSMVKSIDPHLVRNYLVERLNGGSTIQAAISAAIRDGFEEANARTVGRQLKDELVALKQRRALRGAGIGVLLMVGSPFIGFAAHMAFFPLAAGHFCFICGLAFVMIELASYLTAGGRVK